MSNVNTQHKESLSELCCGRAGPGAGREWQQGLQTLGRNQKEDEVITESDIAFIIFSPHHLLIIGA